MSILTHVTVVVDDSGGKPYSERWNTLEAALTMPVRGDSRNQRLQRIGGEVGEAGGTKWFVQSIWAACFNHIGGTQAVVDHLDAIATHPQLKHTPLVATIFHENDYCPHVWTNGVVSIDPADLASGPPAGWGR